MFAIIGSGFGLYGYLPALAAEYNEQIALPERYRPRFVGRAELAPYEERVHWVTDEAAALDGAEGVVLALRPTNQAEWAQRCIRRANVARLLLEKPLAESPEHAAVLLDNLVASKKVFRIGYTFRYTWWGKVLLDTLSSKRGGARQLSIHWSFLAHYYRHELRSWKRFSAEGGGAIRFYGIHLIALLAEAGYSEVTTSRVASGAPGEVQEWTASFAGTGLPECDVKVDTRSQASGFLVHEIATGSSAGVDIALRSPFEVEGHIKDQTTDVDERVPVLRALCRSLFEEPSVENEWYDATITLWRRVEAKTRFEPAPTR